MHRQHVLCKLGCARVMRHNSSPAGLAMLRMLAKPCKQALQEPRIPPPGHRRDMVGTAPDDERAPQGDLIASAGNCTTTFDTQEGPKAAAPTRRNQKRSTEAP